MSHRTLESNLAGAMGMSEEVWQRHANPWSVWTRFATGPTVVLAIWSRAWIGPWAWAITALLVVWVWANPRVFPRPVSTDNWASRAVLGERVWINRKAVPVPARHRLAPRLLSAVSMLGLPPVVWGLWRFDLWPTLLGLVLIYAGKTWFIDRMVWLYQDMHDATPEYRLWLYDHTQEPAAPDDPTP